MQLWVDAAMHTIPAGRWEDFGEVSESSQRRVLAQIRIAVYLPHVLIHFKV
jgi:hypothetical protein